MKEKNEENNENKLKHIYFLSFIDLMLTILIIVYIAFGFFLKTDNNCSCNFNLDLCSNLTIVLSVIGILATITALNIYSIFNARVDEEKDKLETLRKQYLERINKFDDVKTRIDEFENLIKDIHRQTAINQITNSYISISDKVTAISSLTQQIEKFETDICSTDSIVEQNDLKGALYEFSRKIKMALDSVTVPLDANELYRNSFKILKDKVQEIIDRGV